MQVVLLVWTTYRPVFVLRLVRHRLTWLLPLYLDRAKAHDGLLAAQVAHSGYWVTAGKWVSRAFYLGAAGCYVIEKNSGNRLSPAAKIEIPKVREVRYVELNSTWVNKQVVVGLGLTGA